MRQHPVTREKNSRIDIYFGQRQASVAEDVMTLVHQSLPAMKQDDSILIINTLCNHDDLASSVDTIGKMYAAKPLVYSASGKVLREKLDFLSTLIAAKNVRMLIVNSWEFATCGSRQKHALACWLRQMRDAYRLQVVVYSCERDAPRFGALANLSFAASSTANVAAWRHEADYIAENHVESANEATLKYAKRLEAQQVAVAKRDEVKRDEVKREEAKREDVMRDAVKNDVPAMAMSRRKWQSKLNVIGGESQVDPLKNKELTSVSAEVVRMDYAMAA